MRGPLAAALLFLATTCLVAPVDSDPLENLCQATGPQGDEDHDLSYRPNPVYDYSTTVGDTYAGVWIPTPATFNPSDKSMWVYAGTCNRLADIVACLSDPDLCTDAATKDVTHTDGAKYRPDVDFHVTIVRATTGLPVRHETMTAERFVVAYTTVDLDSGH